MADEQRGIVHVTPTDNLQTVINTAQQQGQKTVYMEAGDYQLDYTKLVTILTDNFTLKGESTGSTVIHVSPKSNDQQQDYALVVRPNTGQGKTQIEGVRLADFTLQMDPTLTGGDYDRHISIYLKDCRRMSVERVNVNGYLDGSVNLPFQYGFKADNTAGNSKPAGGIVFDQCGGEQCVNGFCLTGAEPMQRCSLICPSLSGKKTAEGQATGGSSSSLIDTNKDFINLGVQEGYIVHNYTDAAYGMVHHVDAVNHSKLVLKAPGWWGGVTNICEANDAYVVAQPEGYGIYIERAKGTLVLGGAIALFDTGIYIGPAGTDRATRLSQIIGPKLDNIVTGVYIGGDADQTQVVALTRANEGNHVSDSGVDSLIVGHTSSKLPRQAAVYGLLDASTPYGSETKAGTVTRYGTNDVPSNFRLNGAFGNTPEDPLPDGFVGIYYATAELKYYLVTWVNSANTWKKVEIS